MEPLPRWCSILRADPCVYFDEGVLVGVRLWGTSVRPRRATSLMEEQCTTCADRELKRRCGGRLAVNYYMLGFKIYHSPLGNFSNLTECLPACSVTTSDPEFEIPLVELQIWAPAAVIPPARWSSVFLHLRRPAILRLHLLPTRCSRSPSASGLHRHSRTSSLLWSKNILMDTSLITTKYCYVGLKLVNSKNLQVGSLNSSSTPFMVFSVA